MGVTGCGWEEQGMTLSSPITLHLGEGAWLQPLSYCFDIYVFFLKYSKTMGLRRG